MRKILTVLLGVVMVTVTQSSIAEEKPTAAMCRICHTGGPGLASWVKLDDMPADKIYKDLKDFKTGKRTGRVMPWQVKRFKSDAQMRKIADELGTHPIVVQQAEEQAVTEIIYGRIQAAGISGDTLIWQKISN